MSIHRYNKLMHSFAANFYKKHSGILLYGIIFLLSICMRSLPFLLNGPHPLGYDTGFYRRYLIQPFVSFPNNAVPGLGSDALLPRTLLDILRTFNLPTDYILYGSYIFFASLVPCLLYAITRKHLGKEAGLASAFFFIFSPIQYTGFWFMLWKNFFALNLLLILFLLFDKERNKKITASILFTEVLLSLSHTTTSIVYIGTLTVFFFRSRRKGEIFTHILITGTILFSAHSGIRLATKASDAVGVFVEWKEYMTLSLAFIMLGISGAKHVWNRLQHSTLSAFIILTILFPLFRLPFYERIFIFADISLILFASMGFTLLYRHFLSLQGKAFGKKEFFYMAIILISLGNLFGNITKQIKTLPPSLTQADIQSLEEISRAVESTGTIITTSDEAPWYEGFTTSHIAAPGMLNDVHDFEEWNARWTSTSTAGQAIFLSKYPHPLYISSLHSINEIIGEPAHCISKMSSILWKVNCTK